MKISFLMHSLYNVGGTIRTTLNTASALADRGHEVEIATVFRRRTRPIFDFDPRVKVVPLLDVREEAEPLSPADAVLAAKPAKLFSRYETRYSQYNRLADRRIVEYLTGCDAQVMVGTRPGLNIMLAKYRPRTAVAVGQEHLFLDNHGRRLRWQLYRAYRRLDALTTVSIADAEAYRARMPRIASKVRYIPNSVPATTLPPSDGSAKLIVAAGRLEKVKQYDQLLDAFARVLVRHPDWSLRIYGHGRQLAALRERVGKLGMNNSVMLMGSRSPIDAEWVKGSIAAVTSKLESFGLTIVEAMDCGLPVVSAACRYGPLEIIQDGVQGVLTPPDDTAAFADTLCRLIEDPKLRARMSVAARERAARFSPAQVSAEYEELFLRLLEQRKTPVTAAPATAATTAQPDVAAAVSCRAKSFHQFVLSGGQLDGLSLVNADQRLELPSADPATGVLTIAESELKALDEGTWSLQRGGQPVQADRIDSRVLLAPVEIPPSIIAVPFALEGTLAVRVWQREQLAEVARVDWTTEGVRVTGRLVGAPGRTEARSCRLINRKRPQLRHTVQAAGDGENFTLDIPVAPVLADSQLGDLWDLWLLLDEATEIRVGLFLDDLAQRRTSHQFTWRNLPDGRRIQPYFTDEDELSLRVQAVPGSAA